MNAAVTPSLSEAQYQQALVVGARVRLRDPASVPVIGAAEGVVRGRTVSGRLRVEFASVTWHGRALVSTLKDEDVEVVK